MYDKPHFYHGYGLCIGAMVLSIIIILLLDLMFLKANKRAGLGGTEGLAGKMKVHPEARDSQHLQMSILRGLYKLH